MSEEEKIKIAMDLARQGIDLEKIEKTILNVYEYIEPILDLAEKNKRILDKNGKEEKDMCEYCENQKNIKEKNFDITIANHRLIIGNECSEGCGYDRARFNINYCPFCGKKVGRSK